MFNLSTTNPNPTPQLGGQMMGSQMNSSPQSQMASNPPPMTQSPPPAYSHGGRVKKSAMTLAHMSPHELNILDHLQGGTERHNKSGIRSYSHLEELFKNPHLREQFHHHAREHHAQGGEASEMSHGGMEHLREDGRHGDTEMALIGPHTHHFFNQMAGHSTRNPHDGHPEYWSLGGALSGLWSGIKGGASKLGNAAWQGAKAAAPHIGAIGKAALPALTDIASQHLQKHLGDSGAMLGQMAGGLGNAAFSKLQGNTESPMGQAIGEGVGRFAQGMNNGQGFNKSFGGALSHTGEQFGDNPTGNMMNTVGQGMQQGRSARDIGRSIAPMATGAGIQGLMGGREGRRNLFPSGQGMHQAAMQRQQHQNMQDFQELPYAQA